jgi:hypothetical protein
MTDLLEDERKGEADAESRPDRDEVLPEGFRQVFDPIWESLHGKMPNEEDIPGT